MWWGIWNRHSWQLRFSSELAKAKSTDVSHGEHYTTATIIQPKASLKLESYDNVNTFVPANAVLEDLNNIQREKKSTSVNVAANVLLCSVQNCLWV